MCVCERERAGESLSLSVYEIERERSAWVCKRERERFYAREGREFLFVRD